MKKTLVKALTYRVLSLFVTATIGYVLTGSAAAALSFGLVDSIFKMGLYSAHEAAWNNFSKKGFCAAVMSWMMSLASASNKEAASTVAFVKA